MKELVKFFEDAPFILKVIFCIPALDVLWAIYRIAVGISNNNIYNVILGILWIIPGAAFAWVVDLITVLLTGKVLKF